MKAAILLNLILLTSFAIGQTEKLLNAQRPIEKAYDSASLNAIEIEEYKEVAAALELQLAEALEKFGEQHPAVKMLKRKYEAVTRVPRYGVQIMERNRAMSLLNALHDELKSIKNDETQKKIGDALGTLKDIIAANLDKAPNHVARLKTQEKQVEDMNRALQRARNQMEERQAKMQLELRRLQEAHEKQVTEMQRAAEVARASQLKAVQAEQVRAETIEKLKMAKIKEHERRLRDMQNALTMEAKEASQGHSRDKLSGRVEKIESSVQEIRLMLKKLLKQADDSKQE